MAEPVQIHLEIEGMHCGGCVTRVTAALQRLPGVTVNRVEVGSADIQSAAAIPEPVVAKAIHKVGFTLKTATQ